MKILAIVILYSFYIFVAQAELLDKILAIVDDEVITLSQVQRIKSNLKARKVISQLIFNSDNYSDKEIVSLIINSRLVRDKLNEIGFTIGDDHVESNIKLTEQRLNLSRKDLLQYLESNNLTFDEYFEIMRETIEYQYFHQKIIRPLISITEQEIKNSFYKKNINNSTLAFKYSLVDFSIDKKHFKKSMQNNFKKVLKNFQITGNWPSEYKKNDDLVVNTNVLGEITADGLLPALRKQLKITEEGNFTNPLFFNNQYHVFFVRKKDLVESEIFTAKKDQIYSEIFKSSSEKITSLWYQREQNKHYIKTFF